ncbi:MAG: hypothetical protein ACRECR_04565 [Thermoplasmata archaeon]
MLGQNRGPFAGGSIGAIAGESGTSSTESPGAVISAPPTSGGANYETVRITSAVAVVPTNQGEICVGIWLEGGKAPGWLAVQYDTVNSAIFPVGPSGFDATGAIGPTNAAWYPLNMVSGTTFLTAAAIAFGGGLVAARFVFSNQPGLGPSSWGPYRGVAVTATLSSTTAVSETFDTPGGLLLSPSSISAMVAIEAGTATGIYSAEIELPAVTPFGALAVPALSGAEDRAPVRSPIPAIGPASSYNLLFHAISLGGATGLTVVGILWFPTS